MSIYFLQKVHWECEISVSRSFVFYGEVENVGTKVQNIKAEI